MGLRINTNVASIGAQRNLHASTGKLQRSFARLASGLRIATAADDASGLAISERMRARALSLSMASRNILDGISLTQVAEGALAEMGSILIRMKELAVQAQNGTLTTGDRIVIDQEYLALGAEVERITRDTEFNGIELFTANQTIEIQVGIEQDETIGIDLQQLNTLGQVIQVLPLSLPLGPDIPSALITSVIDTIANLRGRIGSTTNTLQSALVSSVNAFGQTEIAESRIRDADFAIETAELTRTSILQQASVAVLTQANASPALALQLLG